MEEKTMKKLLLFLIMIVGSSAMRAEPCPLQVFRTVPAFDVLLFHELRETTEYGLAGTDIRLMPATVGDMVERLLVLVRRTSGDWSVGYVGEVTTEDFIIVVDDKLVKKIPRRSVGIIMVVTRFSPTSREKFRVTDIKNNTCEAMPF
jgi:hypothetical protein